MGAGKDRREGGGGRNETEEVQDKWNDSKEVENLVRAGAGEISSAGDKQMKWRSACNKEDGGRKGGEVQRLQAMWKGRSD